MKSLFLTLLLFSFSLGCKKENTKTLIQNKTTFVTVDENLQPVMDEIMEVFGYNHPKHKISIVYKTHQMCKQDLSNSKVDLVISYSVMTEKEKQKYYRQNKFYFETNVLAFDALLILSHTKTPIYKLTQAEISDLLAKKIYKNKTLCIDGLTANATYDYLSQKFLNGKSFVENVEAAENPIQLVAYIQNNPNKIGFTSHLALNNSIKNNLILASVENKNQGFVYPTQENILSNQYPLIRPLLFVLKHNYETPATTLVSFMQQEKGQLIFKRNAMVPAHMNLSVRKITIDNR